ncbi:MobF family relaxase [Pseudoclavibacter helvolus]|uniref:MobF family relaxase n=1 Tax=Pseudoclavibacter helvolus TaxID=255205 RepID=UPI0024AD972C|nr:MobF family relaxase [Pseudoclavibacter helvolus]
MRGGLVFFRGAGSAARAYLESDHSHADEYYLENGNATAEWTARDASGAVVQADSLDGESYQAWVDWTDPHTGEVRGRPRDETRIAENGEMVTRPASPRFAEMTVNCDKSLSVAAALFPEVSAALDAAQAEAAEAMGAYLAKNSVTRTGPRGAQELVPIERMEQVAVVHRTSRAGDPHRHVHVQWNTRVFAEDKWRGLHTGATLKQQAALRGVASAVIASHAGLREALTASGLTYDAANGKVAELDAHSRLLSKRAMQVTKNVATLEQDWRAANPDREPSGEQRRQWDQQAWAMDRPQKTHATGRAEEQWIGELRDAKLQVAKFKIKEPESKWTLEQIDASVITRSAMSALEERQSAWSVADLEGAIGVELSKTGVVADRDAIEAWVRETAVTCADVLMRLDIDYDGSVPEWVRWITSERVVGVERELRDVFERRAMESVLVTGDELIGQLSQAQSDAARALGGSAPLVVVEGAAGSGKTTMLKEARDIATSEGRRLVVVAPTLRAANEAADALGTAASSAHKLAHEYGFRRNEVGEWVRLEVGHVDVFAAARDDGTQPVYSGPGKRYAVDEATRIIVDEAGMIDQDIALALVRIAEENGAALGFVGDRAQLAAVGRGGVLDMVVDAHPTPLDLAELHRFKDQEYAQLTIQMRDRDRPGELFDVLSERGNIIVHETADAARQTITTDAIAQARAGQSVAVAVATNDDAHVLNALVQKAHADAGHTKRAGVEIAGSDHLTLRIGDRVMTRKNNRDLHVANRDVWTVKRVHRDKSVTLTSGTRKARLPASYVKDHTHLAYSSTEYGVQGATVQVGHGVVTDSTSAAAAYVAATRGKVANTLHVIAETAEQAKEVFVDAMSRESGDRGIEQARAAARRDLDGLTGSRASSHEPRADHTPLSAVPIIETATRTAPVMQPAGAVGVDVRPAAPRSAADIRQTAIRAAATSGSNDDVLNRFRAGANSTTPVSGRSRGLHVPAWAIATSTQPEALASAQRSGRAEELAGRWHAQAQRLAASPPAWTAELGPVPTEATARTRWQQLATEVSAFRERVGLTQDHGPAIPEEHSHHPVARELRGRIATAELRTTSTADDAAARRPAQPRVPTSTRDQGIEL